MINKIAFNESLNQLKKKHPESNTLIEAIQTAFNKNVELISPSTRRALLQFPMQFIQRIPTEDGEWTTQLHIWADNQLEDLLKIDPIMLTARNSYGDTVLHSLVHAALGKFTKQVNHELIEKILQKDMNYAEITQISEKPDDTTTVPGNAWFEKDLEEITPIEYIYDRASSDGEFAGMEPDDELMTMIDNYAESALHTEDEVPVPPISKIDEKQAQDDIESAEASRENTLETDPSQIETADTVSNSEPNDDQPIDMEKDPDEIAEGNKPEESQGGDQANDDSKNVLNIISTLIKLGRSLA